MKKLSLIVAGLVAMSATVSFAQTNAPTTTVAPQAVPMERRSVQGQMPREDFFKSLGLNTLELRTNTPSDRTAKIKAAVNAKCAELSAKKAAGTLTTNEVFILNRAEQMKRSFDRPARVVPQAASPAAPAAPVVAPAK